MPTQDELAACGIDEIKLKKFYEDCVKEAKINDPDGAICGFCGKENDNADDCGFHYVVDVRAGEVRDEKGFLKNPCIPTCTECFKIYYPIHVDYYGMGER